MADFQSRPVDILFPERKGAIENDKCMPPPIGCGEAANDFRDEVSRKEYGISGLCQRCQDEVFGV